MLEDGQKIYIPSIEDAEVINKTVEEFLDSLTTDDIVSSSPGNVFVDGDSSTSSDTGLININKAGQSQLETLPGIGASTALKIIEYRQTNGNFKSIEDLKNVPGIGDAKFNSIKSLICV